MTVYNSGKQEDLKKKKKNIYGYAQYAPMHIKIYHELWNALNQWFSTHEALGPTFNVSQ